MKEGEIITFSDAVPLEKKMIIIPTLSKVPSEVWIRMVEDVRRNKPKAADKASNG